MRNSDYIFQAVERLQELLVDRATGEGENEDDAKYHEIRQQLITDPAIAPSLPQFVINCRNLFQFWGYIKPLFPTYQERRRHIWEQFEPLLADLERSNKSPADSQIAEVLAEFDERSVLSVWHRALERRYTDPAGAITSARTLLETVCKHILDEAVAEYPDDADLPKLYRLTTPHLNLAPAQHQEEIFKQILGGCQSVVQGLGAVRNKLSDSHGQGKRAVKPSPRHAELAVNLAGAMATFLVSTWRES